MVRVAPKCKVRRPQQLFQVQIVVPGRRGGAQEQGARLGEGKLLALVCEEPGAVLRLQGADMLGHRRLGDVQLLGGPGVVHGLAQRQKGFHFMVQHGVFLTFPYISFILWKV